MKHLVLLLLLSVCSALAQPSYTLELTLNGEALPLSVEAPATLEGRTLTPGEGQTRVTVQFAGGSLDLNLADWGTFDYAHVLGTRFRRTGDNTYTVGATVRHDDTGWDNYADAFEIKGEAVENGYRELLHPHENEQPFIRSQSGVVATGHVSVEAKDTVEGWGGSRIVLELDAFSSSDLIEINYNLFLP